MTKTYHDPEDLRNLAEDLKGCVHRHPDALDANKDIADDLVRLRDKAMHRYLKVTEKRGEDG